MTLSEELAAATARVAEAVRPSTVRIGQDARGAGVVVADGQVLTNAHNLRGPQVTVGFPDGRAVRGEVAAADPDGDLAVIRVDTAGAAPVSWSAEPPALGAPVWALTLLHGGQPRVTVGAVSAVGRAFRGPGGRPISGGVEHTAPLARGSSGGPLVDADGRLVGINTHRLGDGFYLAIPAGAELRARVESLARGETPRRHHLGVAIAPPGVARRMRAAVGLPERDGVLVRAVEEASPAASAGVRRGDLIVAAGEAVVAAPSDLFAALDRVGPSETLRLRLVRGADELEVEVRFPATE